MLFGLKGKNCIMSILGSAILAFGLYQIHSFSGVTEGGVLGMTLLLHHWPGISPAISGLVMNLACYIMGWRLLGREFILYSVISGGSFSAFYALFEQFPPLWPKLAQYPLLAAVFGALFVGVGVGLAVRAGGAPGGDDARFPCDALEHPVGLSDERPDRAWLIHQLHSAQASGIFAADGHFVRSVDRVGTACGKKSTGQGLIARLMIDNKKKV